MNVGRWGGEERGKRERIGLENSNLKHNDRKIEKLLREIYMDHEPEHISPLVPFFLHGKVIFYVAFL